MFHNQPILEDSLVVCLGQDEFHNTYNEIPAPG